MQQFKRAQVIMLPTNQSNIVLINPKKEFLIGTETYKSLLQGGKDWIYNSSITDNSSIPQHLYIISDDKIKDGDWYYNNLYKEIYKCNNKEKYRTENYLSNPIAEKHRNKKIIATTDTSLTIGMTEGNVYYISLPQPSQQFITKYIEAYNKSEVITDVLVKQRLSFDAWHRIAEEELLINPKDNTITIKKLKDSWNREELLEYMWKAYKEADTIFVEEAGLRREFDRWINKIINN